MGGSVGKSKSEAQNQMQAANQSQSSNEYNTGNEASANQLQQAQNQYGNEYQNQNQNQNFSQFGQQVYDPNNQALQGMYGDIGSLFEQANAGMQGRIPGAADNIQGVMNSSQQPWQNQMQGGAFQGMDLQGNYQRALNQGGGNEQFINESIMGGAGNNYADAMKGQLQQDSDQRLGQSLAMNDARASGYGQSGSSRHGLTESRLHDDSNRDLSRQQTNIGFNTFDKDLDRKLGIAQRADTYDMNRLQNTSEMLGGQQQAMQGGLNYGQNMQNLGMGQLAPYMQPWQMTDNLVNATGTAQAPVVFGQGSSMGQASDFGSGSGGGSASSYGTGQNMSSGFGSGSAQQSGSGQSAGFGDSNAKGFGTSGGIGGGKGK
jgi:hypothetical protein